MAGEQGKIQMIAREQGHAYGSTGASVPAQLQPDRKTNMLDTKRPIYP